MLLCEILHMSGNLEQFLAEARSPFLRKKAIIFSVPPQIVSPSSNRDLQVVILSKSRQNNLSRAESRETDIIKNKLR